jgi:hypothetical protein
MMNKSINLNSLNFTQVKKYSLKIILTTLTGIFLILGWIAFKITDSDVVAVKTMLITSLYSVLIFSANCQLDKCNCSDFSKLKILLQTVNYLYSVIFVNTAQPSVMIQDLFALIFTIFIILDHDKSLSYIQAFEDKVHEMKYSDSSRTLDFSFLEEINDDHNLILEYKSKSVYPVYVAILVAMSNLVSAYSYTYVGTPEVIHYVFSYFGYFATSEGLIRQFAKLNEVLNRVENLTLKSHKIKSFGCSINYSHFNLLYVNLCAFILTKIV